MAKINIHLRATLDILSASFHRSDCAFNTADLAGKRLLLEGMREIRDEVARRAEKATSPRSVGRLSRVADGMTNNIFAAEHALPPQEEDPLDNFNYVGSRHHY